jgi:hypothetical protein
MSDRYDIDLDELADKPITIRYKGEIHTIDSPDFDEFLKLARMAQGVQAADGDTEQLSEMRRILEDMCPPVRGQKLNMKQTMALINGLVIASVPEDIKALQDQGVMPVAKEDAAKKAL